MNNNHALSVRDLRRRCNLSAGAAARFCGVSARTWRRYESRASVPAAVWRLMMYRAGLIPLPGWAGFRFDAGKVWTPLNECVQAGEVLQFRWLLRELTSRPVKTTFWSRVSSR